MKTSAFTLIESLAAIAVAAIAGSVLLLGVTTSIQTADDAMRRTIAQGIAQQLIDEVVGCKLGAGISTAAGGSRELLVDVGEFNKYVSQPPSDPCGIALGTDDGEGGLRNAAFQCGSSLLANWRQEIDVYYVSSADLTTKVSSGDYIAVEVRVVDNDPKIGPRTLASIRRIVTHVAPL